MRHFIALLLVAVATPALAQSDSTRVLHAARLLDGEGGVVRDAVVFVGKPEDAELRAYSNTHLTGGPHILTSLQPVFGGPNSPSPDSMRVVVRQHKRDGADVINLFASAGLGGEGEQTLSDEQLAAICGQAKAQGGVPSEGGSDGERRDHLRHLTRGARTRTRRSGGNDPERNAGGSHRGRRENRPPTSRRRNGCVS